MAYTIMLAGMAAIYIPGLLWLAVSLTWIADTPSAMTTILRIGLLVPAAGDLITAVPAAALSVRLRKKLS
jgi:biotin transporter BioY